MSINRKFIETIIAANNDNSLAIFIGAGLSKSCETKSLKLPTWKDLIDSLKSDLNIPDETDYLKIAQLYYLAFGEHTYYKKLKNFFPDNIPPSKIHKLIFEINPHVVITTNWDNILETAIEENAYIFDLVCSDKDLVKSTLQNKLIKMHGDFRNHNIVFKENDFIDYQSNFPLVENYIRSIISTHTILFLGYSYSDIDLKQIVKWIQNHSFNVRPPMYLVTYESNQNQISYLENHGIRTIIINAIDDEIKDDADFDAYSKKMFSFLSAIKNNNKRDLLQDPTQIPKFLLRKIQHLDALNGILIEQLQRVLSNCGYFYDDDSRPILEFFTNHLTLDIDKDLRAIYGKFVELLKRIDKKEQKPSAEVLRIFEILAKARIKGIMISGEDEDVKEYIAFEEHITIEDESGLDDLYNFNFENKTNNRALAVGSFDLAFKEYHLGRQEEAFALTEKIIADCLKRRNYMWLFIAMYNRNACLENLKIFSFRKGVSEKYAKYKRYELKERYHNLTKELRVALEPIYEFVDFTFIYRYAYSVSKDLKSTENAKSTVAGGGFVFTGDKFKYSTRHENLVSFVLKNRIFIEDYEEYKSINKAFVRIALTRQILGPKVLLTKTELYSCIRYLKYKELTELFEDLYAEKSEHKGKLQISYELKNWLIDDVLVNVTEQYLKDADEFRRFENYLNNLVFLLSLCKHEEGDLDKILEQINRIVKQVKNTINLFEAINLFFALQYHLFKQEIKDVLLKNLIEILINKLIFGQFNGHEFHALTRNNLSNIYGYAEVQKVIFDNDALIDKLLTRISEYSIEDKIDLTQGFLFSLYGISSQAIKDKIKAFALNIDLSLSTEKYKHQKIIFELTLIIRGFKDLDNGLINEIDKYIEPYKSGTAFSSVLYQLKYQLEYLVNEKSLIGLTDLLKTIEESIKRHRQQDRLGFF